MKMNYFKLKPIMLAAASFVVLTLTNCNKDETPSEITIESITATGTDLSSGNETTKDLNGATAATDVPLDATIIITFSKDVSASSVSTTSVTLNDGTSDVSITVSASENTVTIIPNSDLERGLDHTLTLTGDLKANDGGKFTEASRSFKSAGRADVTPPNSSDQVAYWPFDGNADDAVGSFNADNEVAITYIEDRFGYTSSCASFDGDESIIEIPNGDQLQNTTDFTLSFWMKSNSSDKNDSDETRGQFVMGLAGWYGFQFEIFGNYGGCKLASQYEIDDQTTAAQDLWWSTTGNLGWQGWTYDEDVSASGGLAAIIADQWAHVVVTYDATTKIGSIYINGKLRKSQDFNLYGDTHTLYRAVGLKYAGNDAPGNHLAFGFIQGIDNRTITDDWANPVGFPDNNHFKGELDDIRIFHAAYSADDVTALYNAEK